jgi:hypothetical protein
MKKTHSTKPLHRSLKPVIGSGAAERWKLGRLQPGSFQAADRARWTLALLSGRAAKTHARKIASIAKWLGAPL